MVGKTHLHGYMAYCEMVGETSLAKYGKLTPHSAKSFIMSLLKDKGYFVRGEKKMNRNGH